MTQMAPPMLLDCVEVLPPALWPAVNVARDEDDYCLVLAKAVEPNELVMSSSMRTFNFLDEENCLAYLKHVHPLSTVFAPIFEPGHADHWLHNRLCLRVDDPNPTMFSYLFDDDFTICPFSGRLIGPQWCYARSGSVGNPKTLVARPIQHHKDESMYIGGWITMGWYAQSHMNVGEEILIPV